MASVDPVVGFLLILLALVAAVSLAIALRNRLAFRIAMRNVRRGGRRTILLILGLLIGTTIISGSLVVGDTINQLNLHFTYLADGYVDEGIYHILPAGGGYTNFPYSVYSELAPKTATNPDIAGIAPMIVSVVQVLDRSNGIPQTNLNLIGANGNQTGQLGTFVTISGTPLSGPAPGQVLLDEQAATLLNASAGHTVTLYGAVPVTATVQAVVQDNLRGAYLTGGVGGSGNVFVDLTTAQALYNSTGQINFIAVTNAGSQADGAAISDRVSASLNESLATIPAAAALTVHEVLKPDLALAASSGSGLSTLFLVLGLFSIVAGSMLIVGIFVMLAEERKGEMGMLRAIGLRRGDLVRTFYFEGLAYSAGSALAGTLLGVVTGYGLTWAFSVLLATGVSQSSILQSFTVTTQSLVVAYVVGFLLTLGTVWIASYRASRLNIVRAIRDIPEPRPPIRVYTYLAYLGLALTAVGLLIFLSSYQGTTDVSYPLIGGTLAILGVAFLLSRWVPNRIVFSATGVAFLVWAGLEPLHTWLLGSEHSGGIFVVFVEGVSMVVGALLLYIFNASAILAAVERFTATRSTPSPAGRTALAYPSRQPTRTTINLAIFALVVFTLVAIAGFGSTVEANLSHTLSSESGGYTFFGFSQTSIPDLPGDIAANSTLSALFQYVVPVISGGIFVHVTGFAGNPYGDSLFSAPTQGVPSSNFYTTNSFPFSATWHGMTAAEVMDELRTNASVAIVDQNYLPVTGNIRGNFGGPPHPTLGVGDPIRLTNPLSGNTSTVTVVGIMSQSILSGVWVNPQTASALGYHDLKAFLLTIRAGQSNIRAEQLTKSAFFAYGLVLFDIGALLSTSLANAEGIVGLLQIFVGLGLIVGIAGMGIVALRAVVERRRDIGMLRATGFTRRMILKSFLLEYSFVTLLGILIGTGLGVLIVWNLTQSPSAAASGVSFFSLPVTNIVIILLTAYGLSIAAVAGPSRRAARLPPAEAVRATE